MVGKKDTEQVLVKFCLSQSLNEDSLTKLLQLTPVLQKRVMAEYEPPAGLEDSNEHFDTFVASLAEVEGDPEAPDDTIVHAFLRKWSLNEDALGKLRSLAPELQRVVMESFSPPAHMTEVNGKFIAFASSVEKAHAGSGVPALGLRAATLRPPGGQDDLDAFVQLWSLNEDAQAKLLGMTPALQRRVMREFDPPAHMTEVNGLFIMFALGVEKSAAASNHAGGKASALRPQGGTLLPAAFQGVRAPASAARAGGSIGRPVPPQAAELEAFCQRWELNEDARAKLHKLKPEVQRTVMGSFSPPTHMTEVSGKFIMFAASVDRTAAGASWQGGGSNGPALQRLDAPSHLATVPQVRQHHDAPINDAALQGFSQYWCLNEDAQAKLWSLPPSVQRTVIADFSPPPHLEQVNGKFITFANSVEKAQYTTGGKGHVSTNISQQQQLAPEQWLAPAAALPHAATINSGWQETQLVAFCQYWGLNEDAQSKLWKLHPEVQQCVMAKFNPPPNLTGQQINGKFIMFANSIEKTPDRTPAKGHGKGTVLPPGDVVPQKRGLLIGGADAAMAKRTRVVPSPSNPLVDGFVQRWGLNADASAKLCSLLPEARDIVLSSFAPKGIPQEGGNGWSGKLIVFAEQVRKRTSAAAGLT